MDVTIRTADLSQFLTGKVKNLSDVQVEFDNDTVNLHVKTVNRLNFWGIFWALLRSDLLISGGGSLLQDVTSSRSLYYYLAVIKMAQFLFCPVMLYAQGIGPIQRPFARRLVRHILEQVALISVRDEESKMELESMGVVTPVVEVTADAVLAMNPVDTAIGQHILKQYNIMKYVGATNWFIRWPFLLEGLFLGFIGGVIANVFLIQFYRFITVTVHQSLTFLPMVSMYPFMYQVSGILLGISMIIGAIGSTISLKRYMKV